jgi:acetoin utilization deacetylase AcuC-like enzyme
MVPHILKAALRAAGAVVFGVDLAMSGQTRAAYCNVRPPGHYAEHDHAMGYCIFNNVAGGAAHTLVGCKYSNEPYDIVIEQYYG